MTTTKLVARAPITLWHRDVRSGDIFSTTAEVAERLVAEEVAEVFGDQAIADVPHYEGFGDPFTPRKREGVIA